MESEFFDLVVAVDDGLPAPTPDARSGLDVVSIVRCCDQLLIRCRRPAGPPWSIEVWLASHRRPPR